MKLVTIKVSIPADDEIHTEAVKDALRSAIRGLGKHGEADALIHYDAADVKTWSGNIGKTRAPKRGTLI